MTEYVLLECNRLRGRLNYNSSTEDTDVFKNKWVNNVSSYGIVVNKGDVINVESCAINTSGNVQNTIEILGSNDESSGIVDNKVGFTFSYYINHSGYNSIPLPLVNMQTYQGYANNSINTLTNARNRGLGEVSLTDYSTTPGTEYNNPNNMPKDKYNYSAIGVSVGLQSPDSNATQFIQGQNYSSDTTSRPIFTIRAEQVVDGELVFFSLVSVDIEFSGTYSTGLQNVTIYATQPADPATLTNTAVVQIFVADKEHVSTKKNILPDGRRYFPARFDYTGCAMMGFTGLSDNTGINFDPSGLSPTYDLRTTESKITIQPGLITPQNISTLITERLQKPRRVDIFGTQTEYVNFDEYGVPSRDQKVPVINTEVSTSMSCNFSTHTTPYSDTDSLTGVRKLFYSNIAYENPEKIAGLQFSRQFYYGLNNDDTTNQINTGADQQSNIGDFGIQTIGELGLNMAFTRTFTKTNGLLAIQKGDLILTNVYYTEENLQSISAGFRRCEKYYGDYNTQLSPTSSTYTDGLSVAMDIGMYQDQGSNPTLVPTGESITSGQRVKYHPGRVLRDNPGFANILENVDAAGVCLGTIPPYSAFDDTRNDGQQLSSIVVKSRYSTSGINYQELYTYLTSQTNGDNARVASTTSLDEVFNNSYEGRTIDDLKKIAQDLDLMVVPVWLDSTAGEYYKFNNRPYIAFVSALTTNTDTTKAYNKFTNTNWNIDGQNVFYGNSFGLDVSFTRNNAVVMLNNNFDKTMWTTASAAPLSYYQSYLNLGSYTMNVDFNNDLERFFISNMNESLKDGNGQPYENGELRSFLGLVSPEPETQIVSINNQSSSFNYLSGTAGGVTQTGIADFGISQDTRSIIDSLSGVCLNSIILYDENDNTVSSKRYYETTSFNLKNTLLGKMGFTADQLFPIIGDVQTPFNASTFNIEENGTSTYMNFIENFTKPLTNGAEFSSAEFQASQVNNDDQPLYLLGGPINRVARPQVDPAALNAALEPQALSYPYLCVYSSIIQGGCSSTYHGSIDSKSRIPCVAYINRYDNVANFFYKGLESTYSFTALKDFVLTEITTDIRTPSGTRPRLLEHSSVIYKITKPLRIPMMINTPPEDTETDTDDE